MVPHMTCTSTVCRHIQSSAVSSIVNPSLVMNGQMASIWSETDVVNFVQPKQRLLLAKRGRWLGVINLVVVLLVARRVSCLLSCYG